ncbi:MAG: site-specific integrase [Candidatus Bathyarchaeia archaeon]
MQDILGVFVQNYAEKSRPQKIYQLRRFFEAVGVTVEEFVSLPPEKAMLTVNVAKQYWQQRGKRGLARAVFYTAKALYSFTTRVRLQSLPSERPKYYPAEKPRFTVDDALRVAEWLRRNGRGLAARRNYALTLVLVYSGVRLGAACSLRFASVADQLHQQYITLRITPKEDTKITKPYMTFLAPKAAVALRNYIRHAVTVYGWRPKKNSPLFFAKPDKQIHPNTYRLSFEKAALNTLGFKVTPHAIRRAFNTLAIQKQIPHDVKELLMGHRFGVPEHYAALTPQQLLEWYKKMWSSS